MTVKTTPNFGQTHPRTTSQVTPVFNHEQTYICQHAKRRTISSFCSRDIADVKILQSDWPKEFWSISQESDFPKYRICAGIEQIIKTFIRERIQKKIGVKFFNKFQNSIFGPFSRFLGHSQLHMGF